MVSSPLVILIRALQVPCKSSELERHCLEELTRLAQGNQLILTIHSPELMIAVGSESLSTILKERARDGDNQFVRMSASDELNEALSEFIGSRGIVSLNRRSAFIEGEDLHEFREFRVHRTQLLTNE